MLDAMPGPGPTEGRREFFIDKTASISEHIRDGGWDVRQEGHPWAGGTENGKRSFQREPFSSFPDFPLGIFFPCPYPAI
jgi:hypothetical protein